jgi:hypothetical protein
MKLFCSTLAALALAGAASLVAVTARAEPAERVPAPAAPRARVSPHETISARIDGNRVTIVYGRPYTKDPKTGQPRKIWGGLVPFGKVWRTGADEATLLVTQQPLELGGTALPAGAYTLYTLPAEDGSAQLLINQHIGQWGADPYDAGQEIARVALKKDSLESPVNQFTMAIEKNPNGGGVLKLAWEDTQYSVNYTVKK